MEDKNKHQSCATQIHLNYESSLCLEWVHWRKPPSKALPLTCPFEVCLLCCTCKSKSFLCLPTLTPVVCSVCLWPWKTMETLKHHHVLCTAWDFPPCVSPTLTQWHFGCWECAFVVEITMWKKVVRTAFVFCCCLVLLSHRVFAASSAFPILDPHKKKPKLLSHLFLPSFSFTRSKHLCFASHGNNLVLPPAVPVD